MKNLEKLWWLLIIFIIVIPACRKNEIKNDYSYTIQSFREPEHWYAGECNTLEVTIENIGKIPWVVTEDNIKWRVRSSYHLFKDNILIGEGLRTDFPETVKPGNSLTVKMNIYIPSTPGKYEIVIDLLKEGRFWFKDIGNSPSSIIADAIDPLAGGTVIAEEQMESADFKIFLQNSKKLQCKLRVANPYPELQRSLKLTARDYEKNFMDGKSAMIGWIPGSNYPEIWLRDSYYHSTTAVFFYDPEITKRIIEHFLDYSSLRRGFVPDFVTGSGETGEFSVSSDKYPFLILMACEYLKQSGDYDWLKKKMGKTTIYGMLSAIVEKLFRAFYDDDRGMFFSAHTADWGDVEFENTGIESQLRGRDSHRVAGIYTQALFFAAMKEWSDILSQVHLYQKSMQSMHKADQLKTTVNDTLWIQKRGFFRIHKHLDPLKHDFNEDKIFALGGNIWAIRSGLADNEQAKQIFNMINNIQAKNRYPTISKVLQPSYPKDFFKHPALSEPDFYQNGGFWDWYGGLAVLEEFRNRNYEAALKHIREISASIVERANLFEWYDKNGRGMGSMHYLASGTSVMEAIVRGYYGIEMKGGIFNLSPAFDSKARSFYFNQKERGILIAYLISPNIPGRNIYIQFELAGQKDFQFTLPVIKMNKDEYMKRRIKYDKKFYFYDDRSSFLFYSAALPSGAGKLNIRY